MINEFLDPKLKSTGTKSGIKQLTVSVGTETLEVKTVEILYSKYGLREILSLTRLSRRYWYYHLQTRPLPYQVQGPWCELLVLHFKVRERVNKIDVYETTSLW